MLKYASIDLETTGLDEDECEIVEFGAVLDDLSRPLPLAQLPRFHCYVLPNNGRTYKGDPYALSMHPTIFRRIATREESYLYLRPEQVAEHFAAFLEGCCYTYGQEFVDVTGPKEKKGKRDSLNAFGKNFGSFDRQFIKRKLPGFLKLIRMHHRTWDPGTAYCRATDKELPKTELCLERAGLKPVVAHTAVEDSLNVVQLVRHHFGIKEIGYP
jgi:hypothetical protein